LSTKFPDRILTTPISEAAIIGVATGMALRGLRPIAEIMFGDFIPLIADQLINHAAKFRWIYNDQVRVPIVIRTPMGGRRGYGPTHSQSLEKMIMGVPGIKVVAPNTLFDPAELLAASIAEDDPVVFIEHKLLYRCPLLLLGKGDMVDFQVERTNGTFPAFIIHSVEDAHLSIACYGNNFELCRAAAIELLMDHEIFVEIILFSQLNPFELEPLFTSLRKTRNLLTVEEGTLSVGWGAEVVARAVENMEGLRVRR
jgi:pyruvate/2-oxoglutarate/acetoin dehydrogenase E1 component